MGFYTCSGMFLWICDARLQHPSGSFIPYVISIENWSQIATSSRGFHLLIISLISKNFGFCYYSRNLETPSFNNLEIVNARVHNWYIRCSETCPFNIIDYFYT